MLARRSPRPVAAVSGLACIGLIALCYSAVPDRPSTTYLPEAGLKAFHDTGVRGNVLNSYGLGGYLIFKGVPVFIDGRGDMYGDAFMTETADAMALQKPNGLEALLAKYNIGWTLLGPGTPAIEVLDRLPEWTRVFADSVSVVHVRRDLLEKARGGVH